MCNRIIAHGLGSCKRIDWSHSGCVNLASGPFARDDIAIQRDSFLEGIPFSIYIIEAHRERQRLTFVNGQLFVLNIDLRRVVDGINRHIDRTIHIRIRDVRKRRRIVNGKAPVVVFRRRIKNLAAFEGDRAGRRVARGSRREFNSVRRNQFSLIDIPDLCSEKIRIRRGNRHGGGIFVQHNRCAGVCRETIRVTEQIEAQNKTILIVGQILLGSLAGIDSGRNDDGIAFNGIDIDFERHIAQFSANAARQFQNP